MRRRQFITAAGLAAGGALANAAPKIAGSEAALQNGDWLALRKLFPLRSDQIQLATFLLASHPTPVSKAIERHRAGLDRDPAFYLYTEGTKAEQQAREKAAAYLGAKAHQIALTDSTTMGLAMVYNGLKLLEGDEILHTTHDHYSTFMSLAHNAERTGTKVRQVALYDAPADANVADAVSRLRAAVTSATKVVAVTWVHSSTGVKLPIAALADVIKSINSKRKASRQIIFCVDGVHGFGVEDIDVAQLGCDFFIAGTHKWMFGPRGTGLVWGNDKAWEQCTPVIPSFGKSSSVWVGKLSQDQVPMGDHMTPGGFHSFEHRWALPEAFDLHQQLGKAKVQARIHELNTQTKQGLAAMPNVVLHTPMSPELSAGLVCFDVKSMQPTQVLMQMYAKNVMMSTTPYRESYARFAPSLLNTEQEMERALSSLSELTS